MKPIVPDVSVLLGQILEGEDASVSEAAFAAIALSGAVVRSLFWFEIRNALLVNERRGRVQRQHAELFLTALDEMGFEFEAPPGPAVMDLARRAGLTVYDAAYLELAMRRDLLLATADQRLAAAARAQGAGLWSVA